MVYSTYQEKYTLIILYQIWNALIYPNPWELWNLFWSLVCFLLPGKPFPDSRKVITGTPLFTEIMSSSLLKVISGDLTSLQMKRKDSPQIMEWNLMRVFLPMAGYCTPQPATPQSQMLSWKQRFNTLLNLLKSNQLSPLPYLSTPINHLITRISSNNKTYRHNW